MTSNVAARWATRSAAFVNLILAGETGHTMTSDSLGCSSHEIVECKALRAVGEASSRVHT